MRDDRTSISVAWIMPVIAVLVAAVLFLQWMGDRGPRIEVAFADANGLEINAPIMFRGVSVGHVVDTHIDDDLSRVIVTARLHASAADLARTDSKWWVVGPRVTLSGVSGLETIMGPRYLAVQPGSGEPATVFEGLANPPPLSPDTPGRSFLLMAEGAGSLESGAPVFFRGIRVGSVAEVHLSSEANVVQVRIFVPEPFDRLIRTNTRFWAAGGFSMNLGFTGLRFQTDPLSSLLRGGVSFATPDRPADQAPDGFAFSLADDVDEDWLEWSPRIDLEDDGT